MMAMVMTLTSNDDLLVNILTGNDGHYNLRFIQNLKGVSPVFVVNFPISIQLLSD